MLETLAVIFPVFALIAAGYVIVRSNIIQKKHIPALGKYVLYIALPALILSKLSEMDLTTSLNMDFLWAYGLGALSLYFLIFLGSRFIFKKKRLESAIYSHGASFSNSSFMAFPLLHQSLGDVVIAPFVMALIFENLIFIPLVLSLSENGAGHGTGTRLIESLKATFKQIFKHPLIISITLACILNLLHIPLTPPIKATVDLMGASTTACALVFIGSSLVGTKIGQDLKAMFSIAFCKIALHPAIMAVFTYFIFQLDPQLAAIAVTFASASTMSVYPIMYDKYGYAPFCAGVVLIGTIMAPVSVFIALSYLH
jgi:malonate transporter